MTMLAKVISVNRGFLMVIDLSTRQRVQVNTRDAWRYCTGDLIRIRYSGAMTMSIPPQISATNIILISSPCR